MALNLEVTWIYVIEVPGVEYKFKCLVVEDLSAASHSFHGSILGPFNTLAVI